MNYLKCIENWREYTEETIVHVYQCGAYVTVEYSREYNDVCVQYYNKEKEIENTILLKVKQKHKHNRHLTYALCIKKENAWWQVLGLNPEFDRIVREGKIPPKTIIMRRGSTASDIFSKNRTLEHEIKVYPEECKEKAQLILNDGSIVNISDVYSLHLRSGMMIKFPGFDKNINNASFKYSRCDKFYKGKRYIIKVI